MNTGEVELEQKMARFHKLLDGRAERLMTTYLNTQHKSLSHYSKPEQQYLLNQSKIALLNHCILYLSQQK